MAAITMATARFREKGRMIAVMEPQVVRLQDPGRDSAAAEEYLPAAEKIISGNPRQRIWSQYADATGKFFAGVWECQPGCWRISYTEEEYCRILEGRSVITAADGAALEVGAGDEFVIPRGFAGTWEVLDRTRKFYVIYEADR